MRAASIAVAFALLGAATRQAPPPGAQSVDTPHVTIATSATRPAASGKPVSLIVDIVPKPKMHVYAPHKTQQYIPVSLTLQQTADFKTVPPKFPPPEQYFFAALKETQLVYSKPFRIVQDVTPASGGALTISGTLRYQACDDLVCYPPRNVPVSWVVPAKP